MKLKNNLIKAVIAAMLLSLALVLPFFTGQLQTLGNALCPMHLPVLLCGFFCGPVYGCIIGAVAPLLRFAIFSMPPIMPKGLAMCFELAAYGLLSGLMYKLLPKKKIYIYVSLIIAMLSGRVVWGVIRAALYGIGRYEFGLKFFVTEAFLESVPGIVLQIILIPVLVMIIEKAFPDLNIKNSVRGR